MSQGFELGLLWELLKQEVSGRMLSLSLMLELTDAGQAAGKGRGRIMEERTRTFQDPQERAGAHVGRLEPWLVLAAANLDGVHEGSGEAGTLLTCVNTCTWLSRIPGEVGQLHTCHCLGTEKLRGPHKQLLLLSSLLLFLLGPSPPPYTCLLNR